MFEQELTTTAARHKRIAFCVDAVDGYKPSTTGSSQRRDHAAFGAESEAV
ncbi:hypothetical protein GALL_371400 [mine drainage metagenome]|uniref:Uncharacterized protein n=1 Tax=mine drainage metagenome TaxID=410659 RepID=A0A1J5QMD6_9ZZZZ